MIWFLICPVVALSICAFYGVFNRNFSLGILQVLWAFPLSIVVALVFSLVVGGIVYPYEDRVYSHRFEVQERNGNWLQSIGDRYQLERPMAGGVIADVRISKERTAVFEDLKPGRTAYVKVFKGTGSGWKLFGYQAQHHENSYEVHLPQGD